MCASINGHYWIGPRIFFLIELDQAELKLKLAWQAYQVLYMYIVSVT